MAKTDLATPKRPDAADQLRIVMAANFTARPLLNKNEARVFRELHRIVISRNPGWQVMAQVSLGEIVRSKDADAYGCINSKRVDLLLMVARTASPGLRSNIKALRIIRLPPQLATPLRKRRYGGQASVITEC